MRQYLLVGIPILLILTLWGYETLNYKEIAMSESKPDPPMIGDLYLAPSSQSAKRAAILPTKGSEDATSLLGEVSISRQLKTEAEEYLPNSATEWVVHALLLHFPRRH
jgi:hypothetical protein